MTILSWKADRLLAGHVQSERRHSRGFTLLELLLVLAVMVALGAIAVPGIVGILANRQVARGGSGVRVAMVQARLEAMRTGRTQLMQVEIGGSRFKVVPYHDASDVTEAADMIGRGTAAASGTIAMPVAPAAATAAVPAPAGSRDALSAAVDEEKLPDLVVFGAAQVQATARSSTIDQAASAAGAAGLGAAGALGTAGTAPGEWSQPILFYADGTTSTAIVTLGREEVGRVVIRLRGLTGETRISEVTP